MRVPQVQCLGVFFTRIAHCMSHLPQRSYMLAGPGAVGTLICYYYVQSGPQVFSDKLRWLALSQSWTCDMFLWCTVAGVGTSSISSLNGPIDFVVILRTSSLVVFAGFVKKLFCFTPRNAKIDSISVSIFSFLIERLNYVSLSAAISYHCLRSKVKT